MGVGDRAVLTEAIATFRAALEVITPESDPTSWVFVRYNMTAAELFEFKATGDRSHLERARDALAGVAEVSMDELLLNYRQMTFERLAEIERLLVGEGTS